MLDQERRARHLRIAGALRALDDEQVRALLQRGEPLGQGIGGSTVRVEVEGVPVFAKQLALTDLERRPEYSASTTNCFDLPAIAHYGINSPGFSTRREVALATSTSQAVVAGHADCFLLTHHSRQLPAPLTPAVAVHEELRDVEAVVAYWESSPAVRERLLALRSSTAVVVVFTEYQPLTLRQWLHQQAQLEASPRSTPTAPSDPGPLQRAVEWAQAALRETVEQMQPLGLQHFDTHFDNVLTDGEHLWFVDFGLALSANFDLDPAERGFAAAHASYDESFVLTSLLNWLLTTLTGVSGSERDALVAAAACGHRPAGVPAWAGDLLVRHAPVAALTVPWYRQLQTVSRRTPYPGREITAAVQRTR